MSDSAMDSSGRGGKEDGKKKKWKVRCEGCGVRVLKCEV